MRSSPLACCALLAGCVEVLGASEPILGGTPTEIQSIIGPGSDPDHVELGTRVALTGVFVTGANAQRATMFVQEPDGSTTAGHTYPEFSAMRVFFPVVNFTFPSVGDCVDLEGTVVLFAQARQITATSFARLDPDACGEPPRPLSIPSTNPPLTFADLQGRETPTSPSAPGPKAARYQDVLLSFRDVKVVTLPDPSNNDGFFFAPQPATSPVVLVSNFLVPPPALAVGQAFESITGVYPSVSGTRILNPRSTADYVP